MSDEADLWWKLTLKTWNVTSRRSEGAKAGSVSWKVPIRDSWTHFCSLPQLTAGDGLSPCYDTVKVGCFGQNWQNFEVVSWCGEVKSQLHVHTRLRVVPGGKRNHWHYLATRYNHFDMITALWQYVFVWQMKECSWKKQESDAQPGDWLDREERSFFRVSLTAQIRQWVPKMHEVKLARSRTARKPNTAEFKSCRRGKQQYGVLHARQ